MGESQSIMEMKGSMFTLPVLLLKSFDMAELKTALEEAMSQAPGFFQGAPLVVELDLPEEHDGKLDFVALKAMAEDMGMILVGVRDSSEHCNEAAAQAGLAVLKGGGRRPAAPKKEAVEPKCRPPLVVESPVRSGQQIYAQGRDLIIVGSVSPGAEVISDGNVHVYGTLRGRALAGVQGNTEARIFALKMDAELISVAGNYKLIEECNPEAKGKAAEVRLTDGSLMIKTL